MQLTNRLKLQRGFTIMEFLIAVTILGILTSIAVPIYANLGETFGVDAKQRNLVGSMKFAQTEAVKQNLPVSVCVASLTTADTCSTVAADSWNNGWHVFEDFDGDRVIDASDTPPEMILRTESPIETVSFVSSPNTNAITYVGSGGLSAGGGVFFDVCDKDSDNLDCSDAAAYTNGFVSLVSGQIVPRKRN